MNEGRLEIERDGPLAILTMDNADNRNAFSLLIRDALTRALTDLGNDPSCLAIVLTGANGHFTSGGDLRSFTPTTVLAARGRLEQGSATVTRLLAAGRRPVVTAVEGFCVGVGVSLSAASDFVVMSDAARIRCAFISAGLIPDLGGLWSLPRRVGLGHAKRLAGLGREISPQEALRIGLVDELVPAGGALEAAKKIALEFAAQPPLATALMKAAFAEGLDDVLRREIELQSTLLASSDHQEAVNAFFEKRKPVYIGR